MPPKARNSVRRARRASWWDRLLHGLGFHARVRGGFRGFNGETADDAYARHKRAGASYGYPSCCVEEFSQDYVRGVHSGQERGQARLPGMPTQGAGSKSRGYYVPCSDCRREGRNVVGGFRGRKRCPHR